VPAPIIHAPIIVPPPRARWKQVIEKYQRPSTWRALWQLLNTFVPYALLWYLMHLSVALSWWLTCRWRSWPERC
jgi:omega-6 fatty acid desaturase (delta-12 desaturase)